MPSLTLGDEELRALHDLLSDVTREHSPFPPSPKRRAYLSALAKLTEAAEEESQGQAQRVTD